ncbi:hypothetical protein AB0D30_07905 [Streptomyces sp. NPDC048409]|uniref:hypothetical protein n=1 Tax=unclassified Streptomyces TaxID=2593676 RepID=UPI003433CDCF
MATVEDEPLRGVQENRADDAHLVTGCGRRIEVRSLRLGRPDGSVHRIALDIGEDCGGVPGTWAALSPDEAHALASLLLRQAAVTGHPADATPVRN